MLVFLSVYLILRSASSVRVVFPSSYRERERERARSEVSASWRFAVVVSEKAALNL